MTPAHDAVITVIGNVPGLIRVNLDWWESPENDLRDHEEDREYLNSIIVKEEDWKYLDTIIVQIEYKPRLVYLENTERARKILGLDSLSTGQEA